jgi:hypothetical protein
VGIGASGRGPLLSGATERGVVGFQTSHRGERGLATATSSRIVVASSRRCRGPVRFFLNSLVLPKNWKITAGGFSKPLLPGQQRTVTITARPPRNSNPQALDLPIAILAAPAQRSLQLGATVADLPGPQALIAGLDLLTRVAVPGRPVPGFSLPGPPPAPPVLRYPKPLPPRGPSALTLGCQVVTASTVESTGTLSPAQAGAEVTVTYAAIGGFGVGATHTASTDIDGTFSDTYTPPGPEEFAVQASWPGDGEHFGSESNSCRFGIG